MYKSSTFFRHASGLTNNLRLESVQLHLSVGKPQSFTRLPVLDYKRNPNSQLYPKDETCGLTLRTQNRSVDCQWPGAWTSRHDLWYTATRQSCPFPWVTQTLHMLPKYDLVGASVWFLATCSFERSWCTGLAAPISDQLWKTKHQITFGMVNKHV